MSYSAAILMVGQQGAQAFENGLQLAVMLEKAGYQMGPMETVGPKQQEIEKKLIQWADALSVDLILTMGGVSLVPEDVVPEATQAVCQRMIPGMGEAMRMGCLAITPRAMLSRGTAGIRNRTIILNLPGRAQAAKENLEAVLPAMDHALTMLHKK